MLPTSHPQHTRRHQGHAELDRGELPTRLRHGARPTHDEGSEDTGEDQTEVTAIVVEVGARDGHHAEERNHARLSGHPEQDRGGERVSEAGDDHPDAHGGLAGLASTCDERPRERENGAHQKQRRYGAMFGDAPTRVRERREPGVEGTESREAEGKRAPERIGNDARPELPGLSLRRRPVERHCELLLARAVPRR